MNERRVSFEIEYSYDKGFVNIISNLIIIYEKEKFRLITKWYISS